MTKNSRKKSKNDLRRLEVRAGDCRGAAFPFSSRGKSPFRKSTLACAGYFFVQIFPYENFVFHGKICIKKAKPRRGFAFPKDLNGESICNNTRRGVEFSPSVNMRILAVRKSVYLAKIFGSKIVAGVI